MYFKLPQKCKFIVGIDEVGRAARKRASLAPHIKYIVGIDEVGRGPLAGPVTVAAVCVRWGKYRKFVPVDLRDSKKLTALKRQEWWNYYRRLKKGPDFFFSICSSNPAFIDRQGIMAAVFSAVSRSLKRLGVRPEECLLLLDGGLKAPDIYRNQHTIIEGDENEPLIMLASIIAKVHRDRQMTRLAKKYPEYGFDLHKGYGTKLHKAALKRHGPSEIHRSSYLKKILD